MIDRDKINYLKVTINDADDGTRIMKWLVHRYRNIVQSKECCKRSFHRKEITINGEPVEETRIMHTGDVVEVKYNRGLVELERLKMVPVDIRYQDAHLAVVWKAPGQSFGVFERALPFALERSKDDPPLWCIYTMQKAGSGLLVVTKSDEAKAALNNAYKEGHDFDVTMRVICHGHVPADLLDTLHDTSLPQSSSVTNNKVAGAFEKNGGDGDGDEDDDEAMEESSPTISAKNLLKSLKIMRITRSNNADYLSTLDLGLKPPISTIAIRSLFYYHSSYPIVGNSTYTKFLKSSRDKGLCMSVTSVSLVHPVTGKRMTWTADEPEKFELLRAREQKFWRRKLDEKLAALEKAGLLTTMTSGHDGGGAIDNSQEEQGRPLAYILGKKEFYGVSFKVTDACLIPRPSTETLVDATLAQLPSITSKDSPPRVLDIGTGCGNVLLSIIYAGAADVKGVGIDISKEALSVARENQASLGIASSRVEWQECDMALLNDQFGVFDVVVCNPPYLNKNTIEQQKNEFRMLSHEPAQALFADDDGYGWYKVLSEVAPTVMRRRSKLVLECGKGMMDRVKLIMSGWKTVEIRKDKQGWDRCLVLELE